MKKIINILTLAAVSVAFTSCDDLFEPAIENNLGLDYMYENPQYAEGVLGNAYTRIPCADFPFSEVATDDAVSNDATNDWRKIASGTWTSNENPSERWRNCRAAIMYLNLFLANADKVNWANDEMASRMFNDREKGEAYGMRAMYMYYLLQAHGGMTADGQLLGVPIVTEPEDASSEFNLPRNTFAECLQAIYDDCDRALELLPTNYKDIKNNDVFDLEHFTYRNIETEYQEENLNDQSISFIITPFNSKRKDNDEDLFYNDINIENHLMRFLPKVNELNKLYELNNNCDFDQGVMLNRMYNYDNKLMNSFNESYLKKQKEMKGKEEKRIKIENDENKIDKNNEIEIENKINNENISLNSDELIFEENIISYVENLGYKREYIIKSLELNELNYATATYFLKFCINEK